MAKADLNVILENLSGRISGNSELYVAKRHGKTVVSNYPLHKNKKKLSDNQKAAFASFGERSKQTQLELADPQKRAIWQQRYQEHLADKYVPKRYTTLRGFVLAQLAKN